MSARAIVIDRHEEARHALVRLLEQDGRVRVVYHSGSVEPATIATQQDSCDFSLLNIRGNDDESIAHCQALREGAGVPVVVLASFMTAQRWQILRRAGATDYLLKDANGRRLCDTLVLLAQRLRF